MRKCKKCGAKLVAVDHSKNCPNVGSMVGPIKMSSNDKWFDFYKINNKLLTGKIEFLQKKYEKLLARFDRQITVNERLFECNKKYADRVDRVERQNKDLRNSLMGFTNEAGNRAEYHQEEFRRIKKICTEVVQEKEDLKRENKKLIDRIDELEEDKVFPEETVSIGFHNDKVSRLKKDIENLFERNKDISKALENRTLATQTLQNKLCEARSELQSLREKMQAPGFYGLHSFIEHDLETVLENIKEKVYENGSSVHELLHLLEELVVQVKKFIKETE